MFIEQPFNIPSLVGISEKTIEEHKKLYGGYVKNAHMLLELLEKGNWEGDGGIYARNELQRRFAFEWGGMRNHEVYFALLEGGPNTDAPTLIAKIESQWGSFDTFITRFKTLALTRGVGWAMLSYDKKSDTLLLGWVDEQHLGQLVDTTLIFGLDMWEHSYVADYQPSGKKQYIEDFFNNVSWSVAEKLFIEASS